MVIIVLECIIMRVCSVECVISGACVHCCWRWAEVIQPPLVEAMPELCWGLVAGGKMVPVDGCSKRAEEFPAEQKLRQMRRSS